MSPPLSSIKCCGHTSRDNSMDMLQCQVNASLQLWWGNFMNDCNDSRELSHFSEWFRLTRVFKVNRIYQLHNQWQLKITWLAWNLSWGGSKSWAGTGNGDTTDRCWVWLKSCRWRSSLNHFTSNFNKLIFYHSFTFYTYKQNTSLCFIVTETASCNSSLKWPYVKSLSIDTSKD